MDISVKNRSLLYKIIIVILAASVLIMLALKVNSDGIKNFISLERLGVLFLISLSCFLLEIIFMGWRRSSLKKIFGPTKTTVVDIFSYLFSAFRVIDLFAISFSFGLSTLVPNRVRNYFGYNLIQSIDSVILQNILYVLMLDFVLYWVHRFLHTSPAFWELHKFHHSATELNIITTSRLHPIEHAINSIVFSFPIFIVGMPVEVFFIFFYFTNWLGHIHHSMINWNWGLIGDYILISPVAHRIHHSKEKRHYNKNFGTITPLWDRLFGTWYMEKDVNETVGIEEDTFNKEGILYDYINSTFKFVKKILPNNNSKNS